MSGLSCRLSGSDSRGLIDCKVRGKYESTPGNGMGTLDDSTEYKFSLCEFCLDWLFVQFKVPVEVSDYMNPNGPKEKWVSAKDRVHKDNWRKMKTVFFDEFEKRNKARNRRITTATDLAYEPE
jgi:hypothetical protein